MVQVLNACSKSSTGNRKLQLRDREVLELYFAGENLPEHHEITSQTVERVGERGRLVFLEEEVSHPGKSVTGERHSQEEQIVLGEEGNESDGDNQKRTAEVQAAIGFVLMLREIERVKLGERCVLFTRFHVMTLLSRFADGRERDCAWTIAKYTAGVF